MALINKLEAIADAIRAKTGETAELTLDQMATKINTLRCDDPEFIEGGITPNNGCAIESSTVRRYGNIVIVEARVKIDYYVINALPPGTKILTFNDGWKAKEDLSVMGFIDGVNEGEEGKVYSKAVNCLLNQGDGGVYIDFEFSTISRLHLKFYFEAQPLQL